MRKTISRAPRRCPTPVAVPANVIVIAERHVSAKITHAVGGPGPEICRDELNSQDASNQNCNRAKPAFAL
jgi:hypothetical protein